MNDDLARVNNENNFGIKLENNIHIQYLLDGAFESLSTSGPHIKQMVTTTRNEINVKLSEIKKLELQMEDYEKRRSEYCSHEFPDPNIADYIKTAAHNK